LWIDPGPRPAVSLFQVKARAVNIDPGIKAEPELESDELWFKDAIIYQLHVKAFADGNNDGISDFAGLTEKLDYLGGSRRHSSLAAAVLSLAGP
jgi:hypothetical protein